MTSKELTQQICKKLADKKGADIAIVEIKNTSIADYFVIASGKSAPQCRAMAENVEGGLEKEFGVCVRRTEGISQGNWIAMDYTDVVVHIFLEDTRKVYQLDKLWNNGNNVEMYVE